VADRSLVLDANILVRAVLGVRVRSLLERYGRDLDFTAPDEVEDYLPPILVSRGLSPDLGHLRAGEPDRPGAPGGEILLWAKAPLGG
jgi:hypothetical protein